MKQQVIAWIEKQLEIIGHQDELLDGLKAALEQGGLEAARGFLVSRGMFKTLMGDSYEGGIAVGLVAGIDWLQQIEESQAIAA